MKRRNPPLQTVRLLDPFKERIRYFHYSLSAEKTDLLDALFRPLAWPQRRYDESARVGRQGGRGFLTMLATERDVSTSTRQHALNALLSLIFEELEGVCRLNALAEWFWRRPNYYHFRSWLRPYLLH